MTDSQPINISETLRLHTLWLADDPAGIRANLSWANLRDANLSGADLSGANLSGANLSGADLRCANLSGANLSGADLRCANLSWANLRDANLSGADLSGANLSGANLSGADLRCANGLPIAADAKQRLRAVASHVLAHPQILQMKSWHSECGTTHCLAGWAIHQAGTLGEVLEKLHGPHVAGLLLLGVDAAEHFYDGTDEAIEWLQSVAQEAA
jgi:hypothetical protein